MNKETEALLEESERLLQRNPEGPLEEEKEYKQPTTGKVDEVEGQWAPEKKGKANAVIKKKREKKFIPKAKASAVPNFGDRLKTLTDAEVKRDEKELDAEQNGHAHSKPSGTKVSKHAQWTGIGSATLADREWENELARSILTLYHANKNKSIEDATTGTRRRLPAIQSSPELKPMQKKLKRPRQIWFTGSGAVKAVWCCLSNQSFIPDPRVRRFDVSPCRHALCGKLREMEQKGLYDMYVDTVVELLQDFSRRKMYLRAEEKQEERRKKEAAMRERISPRSPSALSPIKHIVGHQQNSSDDKQEKEDEGKEDENDKTEELAFDGELQKLEEDYFIDWETIDPSILADPQGDVMERMMWRQAVICCNIFGQKFTDRGKPGAALALFKRAESLLETSSNMEGSAAFAGSIRTQLRGFLFDSLAYYYYKRKKANAAASYAQRAMRAHVKLGQWQHVAKCHLHCGTVLSMMNKHDDAIQCLSQVLQMVDDERLEVGGTNAQKICLVAVCYHNIAVEQLLLRRPAEACVSSQNARKLARLSLSYSNRWINSFEKTHQFALQELSERHSYLDRGAPISKAAKAKEKSNTTRRSLKNPKARKLYESLAASVSAQLDKPS